MKIFYFSDLKDLLEVWKIAVYRFLISFLVPKLSMLKDL